jgi:hypothetical protein
MSHQHDGNFGDEDREFDLPEPASVAAAEKEKAISETEAEDDLAWAKNTVALIPSSIFQSLTEKALEILSIEDRVTLEFGPRWGTPNYTRDQRLLVTLAWCFIKHQRDIDFA